MKDRQTSEIITSMQFLQFSDAERETEYEFTLHAKTGRQIDRKNYNIDAKH